MPSTPLTPAGRAGCSACPDLPRGENTTPQSIRSVPKYTYGSVGRGRSLGRRSLDAVRSVRGSIRGRRALGTTTNQQPASLSTAVSAGSSPIGPPAKQRWFETLRSRPSQIPSPTSLSSSVKKRTIFVRSSPVQAPAHDSSPSAGQNDQPSRDVLPTLELSSFQSELQRLSIFGQASEKAVRDTKPRGEDIAPKKTSEVKTVRIEKKPSTPAISAAATVMRPNSPASVPVSVTGGKAGACPATVEVKTFKPNVAFVDGEPATTEPVETDPAHAESPKASPVRLELSSKTEDQWRTQCALYYKGSPWQQDRFVIFPSASSALSHVALHNMLNERRRCSSVLLWTGDISYTNPQTKQTLTIYPHYEGPRRIEIEEKYCLEWAFLVFSNDPKSTRLPPMEGRNLEEEDPRLMTAIKALSDRGYHVDVWTCRDNEEWDFDIDCVRGFDTKAATERLQNSDCLKRRARYEAFIRHGVSGFSEDDISILDDILEKEQQVDEQTAGETAQQNDLDVERQSDFDYIHDGCGVEVNGAQQFRQQTESEPEFNGFLEHQEETIITEDEVDGKVEASKDADANSLCTVD